MRKAIIIPLKENYYNFYVLIFVNDILIGTGAFFHRLSQVQEFLNGCKVEFYSIAYKEGNE